MSWDNEEQIVNSKEVRRCIVTGLLLPKTELLRFVVGPANTIVADIACKLPGKGIWVSCDSETVATAIRKRLFSKAAKTSITLQDGLLEQIDLLLKKACLNMLAMAKKSGLLVTGYTKVSILQEEKKSALIFRACDSAFAAHEKQKIGKETSVIMLFNNDELSSALGCENVVHAALMQSAMTAKCTMLIKRYKLYIRSKP